MSAGVQYTHSLYVKYAGQRYVYIGGGDASRGYSASFDILSGTFVEYDSRGGSGPPDNHSITNVGNGWYRISITFTAISSGTAPQWANFGCPSSNLGGGSFGNGYFTGSPGNAFYVWGYQKEIGAIPSPYIVNTSTSLTPATVNDPRVGAEGIGIENVATNYVLYCRDLGQSVWTKSSSTSAVKNVVGVDGYTASATEMKSNGSGTISQSITVTPGTYTLSFYAKFGGYAGSTYANVSLDGGSTTTSYSVTSGYQRFTATQTISGTSINLVFGFTGASGVISDVIIDYIQIESGSIASSPIYTTTAMATRGEDVSSLTYSPTGSLATYTSTNGSGNFSPSSPLNLGYSSGEPWTNGYLQTLTIT